VLGDAPEWRREWKRRGPKVRRTGGKVLPDLHFGRDGSRPHLSISRSRYTAAMTSADVETVSILGQDSIHVGLHLAPHIARTVCSGLPASAYVLVTDTHIAALHLDSFAAEFRAALAEAGSRARLLTHVVPPGEGTKSRAGKAAIEDFMLAHACTRDTVLLALGGGVIGDLVGFVAATLCVPRASHAPPRTHARAHTACAGSGLCRCRRRCSRWSTRPSAARPRSTPPRART
jgi:hypothetical protein